jgi:tetratricopeptide (TPR) repeat protein
MRRRLLSLLPLLAAVLFFYSPSFHAGYTNWDDPDTTYNNPVVAHLTPESAERVLVSLRLANYHPLTDLSLAAESAFFGQGAAVHHAGNVLLHSANAALVFLLLAELLGSGWPALAGALLWALHPANVESAAWLSERKNLLYAFFYLAALLAYLRRLRGEAGIAPVFTLFALALLSKASATTLPLALLALDWKYSRPLDKKNMLEKGAMLALALLFTALMAAAQGRSGKMLPGDFPRLLSFYLAKACWPAGLCALYPYKEALAALKSGYLLYTLPAAAFAAALLWSFRKNRTAALGLLFFLVNILPFTLIIPIGPSLAADRYLYIPLIGLILAAAAALEPVLRRPAWRWTAAAAFLACLGVLSVMTARRVKTWESSETLWTGVLARYPKSEVANLNMAQALLESGDWPRAQGYLKRTLEADPDNPDALYNLGTTLGMAGRPAEALPLLERSVMIKPDAAAAWNNLGLALAALGRRAEARKAFLTATAADPGYRPAYANLAAADKKNAPLRSAR